MPVRVLLIEDNPLDAELIGAVLADSGLECELRRVDTAASLGRALEADGCDVILSDFALPAIDGLTALRMARAVRPDVPFILVSGAVGEERAIDVIKGGATDYVLKDRLERLPAAVRRALQEAEERIERRRAEQAVRILADVGRTLGTSLDLDTTLQELTEQLIPFLADYCLIELIDDALISRRVAVADVDPIRGAWLRDGRARFPLDPNDSHGAVWVMRTGRSEIVPHVDGGWLQAHSRGPEHEAAIHALRVESYLCVPLPTPGRILGVLWLISAGSGRRYSASDLPLAEELARRAALSIENSRLYQEAQDAIRERGQILAVVSHDLKNPLSAILMTATAMQRGESGADEPARRRLRQLGIISNAARRMEHLVHSLLDMASIEAGRLHVQPRGEEIDVLLAAVSEMMQPLGAQRSITVEILPPARSIRVWCDRERILQVFSNLVGNAIKFSPAASVVRVVVEVKELEAWFSVIDRGPGIASEDLPYIFERFWQKRRTETGGTGLGLFITRGLVEAHGGTVRVDSTPGEGSVFSFSVPLEPGTPGRDVDLSSAAPPGTPPPPPALPG